MILKNDALQELYDTLTYGPVLSSPYAESPIDRAFKECDEKLSESIAFDYLKKLQDRIEVLERSNKALRDNNDKLGDKIIELKKELDAKTKENATLVSANADLSDRNAKLQRNFDRINHLWTGQIQENMELRSKITNMQREKKNYETIAKEREELLEERDGWRSRALEAEKRVGELLLKKYDQDFEDLRKERDRYSGLYTELKKDYDRLFEENRSLKEPKPKLVDYEALRKELDLTKRNRDGWKSRAMHTEKRYAELRKENADLSEKVVDFEKRITELQKKGDDLTKKGEDLQQEIEELKKSRKHLRRLYVGKGARKLWDMLQNVNDVEPEEFDPEFKTLSDILCMDLKDFLDAYKKWLEKKELDHMRDYLDRFCIGRLCYNCPLHADNVKCEGVFGFNNVPDEDIKKYYEKARGCGHISSPMEGVNRAISKACEDFCKAVRDADNKIIENLRKGGTLEATVEVDKDLLNTVLGIKPKEEEHKLDYGDAVRVPWRDYDYMYIGPEGNHIRLFDPKTHAVVVVSVKDNLTYQGCKIILCDEDDIRKIWKDKK